MEPNIILSKKEDLDKCKEIIESTDARPFRPDFVEDTVKGIYDLYMSDEWTPENAKSWRVR